MDDCGKVFSKAFRMTFREGGGNERTNFHPYTNKPTFFKTLITKKKLAINKK